MTISDLSRRKLMRSIGTSGPPSLLNVVQQELGAVSNRHKKCQERPMIKAFKYMNLRSLTEAEKRIQLEYRRAHSAMRKYQKIFLYGQ